MASIMITVPDGLREKMEAAWPGTTLEEHLQARVDDAVACWTTEAPAVVKRERLGKYDRLTATDQGKVDVLLEKALPVVKEEIELSK